MKRPSQNGIAHIGLLLLVLVVAVIAFVGYRLEQSRSQDNSPTASSAGVAQTPQAIPAISSKSDLNSAAATLDSQNVDGDLNPDSYNSDVSSLQ